VTSILPLAKTQFFDSQGVPLAGGSVGYYVPATLTPKQTWQDQAQSTPNTTPIVTLDGAGEALIWGSGAYRQIVKDAAGNLIWDQPIASFDFTGFYAGGTSTGTAAVQALALTGFALTTGSQVTFVAGFTNSGALTLNVNATGAKPVLKWGAAGPVPLVAGDIGTGDAVQVFYDGTQYQVISPLAPPGTNSLTNTRLAKTAAYLVANADKGDTIALGGSSIYTLTFAGAAGYDANFLCLVINEDTSRGKTVSLAGVGTFILWPGQSCIVFASNNTWHSDAPNQRWVLPNSTTFYVDPVNGLDTNDGLAAGASALRTIQAAENLLKNKVDFNGQSVIVQLAAGTYNENVVVSSQPVGGHVYTIHGDNTTPTNCVLNGGGGAGSDAIFVTDYGAVTLDGIEVTNAGANCIHVTQGGICDIKGGTNLFNASVHVLCAYGGRVNFTGNYTIGFNAVNHVQVIDDGTLSFGAGITVSLPNPLAFTTFAQVTSGSVDCSGVAVTFSGAGAGAGSTGVRYAVALNGVLQLSGTVFPGNAGGTTASGGQVAA